MRVSPISLVNVKNRHDIKNAFPVHDNINLNVNANKNIYFPQNFFYYPVSFGAGSKREYGSVKKDLAEKSGDFRIARFPDVTCPACGRKMLNRNQMQHIYKDLQALHPDEYLEYLEKYRDYMRPVEASVFDEISEISKKTGYNDIRTLVVSLRDEKMPLLQHVQMRQIKKMRALARTLPKDEKEVLMKKLNGLEKIIRKNNSTSPFRRKILIDRMSKLKIRNPKKYHKVQILVKGFPTSKDMNSAWIVKYSGNRKNDKPWTSQEIAMRFLEASLANTDHILAYNIENNHDDITNYMAMHSYCNSEKGNKPFLQWLNEDRDNRIQYMKQYFQDVDNIISSRKLKKRKYRNYVALATESVEKASRGQVTSEMLTPVKEKPLISVMQ